MITLFCIRRRGDPAPTGVELPGVGPVRLIEDGPIGLWVVDGRVGEGLSAVRAHDSVVRAALRSATPLPARFGTVFPTQEALMDVLRDRNGELVAALARVEGAVEMGVRVGWGEREPERNDPPGGGGRAFLEARKREFEVREQMRERADALLDAVERLVPPPREKMRRVTPEPGVAGALAHLVQKESVRSFREAIEAARPAFPGVELRPTGPWAPYSFV